MKVTWHDLAAFGLRKSQGSVRFDSAHTVTARGCVPDRSNSHDCVFHILAHGWTVDHSAA